MVVVVSQFQHVQDEDVLFGTRGSIRRKDRGLSESSSASSSDSSPQRSGTFRWVEAVSEEEGTEEDVVFGFGKEEGMEVVFCSCCSSSSSSKSAQSGNKNLLATGMASGLGFVRLEGEGIGRAAGGSASHVSS